MTVTFRSLRSGRIWTARFEFGSEEENALCAVKVAWQHNAEIISHV